MTKPVRQIHGWDPNQRSGGGERPITFVGFEDCGGFVPSFGDRVLLVESESGLTADATVIDVDHDRQIVHFHFKDVRRL